MSSSWPQLESEGWERRENASGKSFYVTPLENGERRRIYQSRDLPSEWSHLQIVLFPPKVRKIYSMHACMHVCMCDTHCVYVMHHV
jgi:hypothetical protein